MLSLVIHHNLHLTREQRYALHEKNTMECIGVIVPVWVSGAMTSEPAREVFCRYRIKNTGEKAPIKLVDGGFELTIPDRQPIAPPQCISNEEWREMTEQEKEEIASFQMPGSSSLNLLDLKDGGTGTLMYREHSKIRADGHPGSVAIVHLVQIRPIEDLKTTCSVTPRWSADNPAGPAKSAG